MTLAQFIQKLITLGASADVIAVTVEYVTECDASRRATRDGGVMPSEAKLKSAIRSRNYRANKKSMLQTSKCDASLVTECDVGRDISSSLTSSLFAASPLKEVCKEGRSEIVALGENVSRENLDDWPADYETVFWTAYPRKIGRKNARAKLRLVRQRGEATFAKLMAAVNRYADACKKIESQYVKHPATWLNGGCWDDEHMPEASNGSRQLQDDSRSIGRAAERMAEGIRQGVVSFAPRPSLLPDESKGDLRLLSKG